MLAKLTGISTIRHIRRLRFASPICQAIVAMVCAVALCSCSQVSVPKPKTNIRLAPAPFFDDRTGIYFPGAIGTLHRQSVVQLEDKTPGLGVALSYRDSNSKLDIFAYDLRAPLIPRSTDSPIVRKSFEDAVANIEKAAARGLYSQLEIKRTSSINIAGQEFLRAQMSYGENLVQKNSELLVSGVNGQILKIRIATTSSSNFDLQRTFSHIEYVIQDSRQRGFGDITHDDFEKIEASLKRISLSDGLNPTEAKAIAQMEMINRKLHYRFDPTKVELIDPQNSGNPIISFEAYSPLLSPAESIMLFEVLPSGFARPISRSQI